MCNLKPSYLRCEYKIDPIGIDVKKPRLSWIVETITKGLRGQKQTAYQIIVSYAPEDLKNNSDILWNSEKVISSDTSQIYYEGKKLNSLEECFWKVRIWDQNNVVSPWSITSRWTMGFLHQNDWKAEWIEFNKWQVNYETKKKFEFVKGYDKWIWYPKINLENNKNILGTFYFRKAINLNKIKNIKSAFLLISADEKFTLFINNRKVAFSDKFIFSWSRPKLVNVKKYLIPGKNIIVVKALNTYLDTPGLICKLFLEFNNGKKNIFRSGKDWKVTKKYSINRNSNILNNNWTNAGAVCNAGINRRIPSHELKLPPPVYFRKTFTIPKKIKKAYAFVTALGLFEFQLNGETISEYKLTPGWTDYNKRVHYISYDIREKLKTSFNSIGLNLSRRLVFRLCRLGKGQRILW